MNQKQNRKNRLKGRFHPFLCFFIFFLSVGVGNYICQMAMADNVTDFDEISVEIDEIHSFMEYALNHKEKLWEESTKLATMSVDETQRGAYMDAYLFAIEYHLQSGDAERTIQLFEPITNSLHQAVNEQQYQDWLKIEDVEISSKEAAREIKSRLGSIDRKLYKRSHVLDIFQANAEFELGNTKDGLRLMLRALQVNPFISSVYKDIGDMCAKRGFARAAYAFWFACWRLTPEHPVLEGVRGYVQYIYEKSSGGDITSFDFDSATQRYWHVRDDTFRLRSGEMIKGEVVRETSSEVRIKKDDGTFVNILKKDIVTRLTPEQEVRGGMFYSGFSSQFQVNIDFTTDLSFRGKFFTTSDDDWSPTLRQSQRFKTNEKFDAVLSFVGFGVGERGKVDIKYDVTVFAPDGTIYFEAKDVNGINAEGRRRGEILLSEEYFLTIFEEGELFGEYKFQIIAKDLIKGQTSRVEKSVFHEDANEAPSHKGNNE